MKFDISEIDKYCAENRFEVMFMSVDTWTKCNRSFVTHDNKEIQYRKVRVIYFEDEDLKCLNDELRSFFQNGGIDAQ